MSSINPLMFGAKGDGIADDTVAIQQAIDNCINGGRVELLGSFRITETLVLSKSMKLFGPGKIVVDITQNKFGNCVFNISGDNVLINGITIEYPRTSPALFLCSGSGTYIYNCIFDCLDSSFETSTVITNKEPDEERGGYQYL